ncbi:MAG: ABC transporter ATP-binding protein [Clostridia bacterium]|nr:ABC transporter ATP-binding protein [Clostridia bacterium]
MSVPMIEINNITKQYRLGAIGGRTLREDLQSRFARLRGREDPNVRIGAQPAGDGRFLALDGVSISVQAGEAVGLIGHNGAGKSTLLKLISRVTAPTSGEIRLQGRVASMLEVGTGFHPELTGRENVYLNGAILGMTKKEIDAKFDEIVEFAEMAPFIDTPVKRYSSGMYVKLAFSVAAHLDAEIMLMDEVLAVGDAAFQNKCLAKMSDASSAEGRTILYVSHNMNTIQRLCRRVIVLEHGRVAYDGDTEGGVARYLSMGREPRTSADLTAVERPRKCRGGVRLIKAELPGRENALCRQGERVTFRFRWHAERALSGLTLRLYLCHATSVPAAFVSVPLPACGAGETHESEVAVDLSGVVAGSYYVGCDVHEVDDLGHSVRHDFLPNVLPVEVTSDPSQTAAGDRTDQVRWNHSAWGSVRLPAEISDHITD